MKTPLHLAVENGHYRVVEYLLNCNAKINVVDLFNKTPLNIAIDKKHKEITHFIKKKGGKKE